METKSRRAGMIAVGFLVVFVCLWGSAGCRREVDPHEGHDHDVEEGAHGGGHENGGDWCAEHGVAESACTRCNPSLVAEFKAKGDWCAGHKLPESQCMICNPIAAEPGGRSAVRDDELARLETRQCEHGGPILACDECRYQVGVVKLDASLAEGLISTARAEKRAVVKTLSLTGQVILDPTRVVEIVPMCGGVVSSVRALLGDEVEQGDVLAVIRSSELGDAKASFLEADASLSLSKKNMEREQALHKEGISSESEYLDAEKEYLGVSAKRAAAQKKLFVLGLTAAQVKAIGFEKDTAGFADLEMRAPRDGKIIEQNISVGRFIESAEHVFTVADLSSLWVWCDLYERDLGVLHASMLRNKTVAADVMVRAFPGTRFEGTIDLIGSTVDARSRTVKVRVQVPNREGKLRPGMFATVEARFASGKQALVVPSSAVLADEGASFVFQHWRKDLWVRRDVEVAAAGDGIAQISDGLTEGAVIATDGGFMFKSDVLRAKMGAG